MRGRHSEHLPKYAEKQKQQNNKTKTPQIYDELIQRQDDKQRFCNGSIAEMKFLLFFEIVKLQ